MEVKESEWSGKLKDFGCDCEIWGERLIRTLGRGHVSALVMYDPSLHE